MSVKRKVAVPMGRSERVLSGMVSCHRGARQLFERRLQRVAMSLGAKVEQRVGHKHWLAHDLTVLAKVEPGVDFAGGVCFKRGRDRVGSVVGRAWAGVVQEWGEWLDPLVSNPRRPQA